MKPNEFAQAREPGVRFDAGPQEENGCSQGETRQRTVQAASDYKFGGTVSSEELACPREAEGMPDPVNSLASIA